MYRLLTHFFLYFFILIGVSISPIKKLIKNKKKTADINKYILIGFRYDALRPFIYSSVKKPGLMIRYLMVAKNLPSKCVTSLKKWTIRCHADSLGSTFSWPQLWQ